MIRLFGLEIRRTPLGIAMNHIGAVPGNPHQHATTFGGYVQGEVEWDNRYVTPFVRLRVGLGSGGFEVSGAFGVRATLRW